MLCPAKYSDTKRCVKDAVVNYIYQLFAANGIRLRMRVSPNKKAVKTALPRTESTLLPHSAKKRRMLAALDILTPLCYYIRIYSGYSVPLPAKMTVMRAISDSGNTAGGGAPCVSIFAMYTGEPEGLPDFAGTWRIRAGAWHDIFRRMVL